jgi:hypothetical protein
VVLPDPRFTLNVNDAEDLNGNQECDGNEICNGTVIDNLTGLVWMQNVDCFGALTLSDATVTINALAGKGSQCGVAGGSQTGGWRLPNILEALSLVDFSQVFPSPAFTPENSFTHLITFEEAGGPARYWSSTGYPNRNSAEYVSDGYNVSYGVGWVERWTAGVPAHAMAVK